MLLPVLISSVTAHTKTPPQSPAPHINRELGVGGKNILGEENSLVHSPRRIFHGKTGTFEGNEKILTAFSSR